MIVQDTLEDERFKHSDLVLGPPHIRFYAGAPLEYDMTGSKSLSRPGSGDSSERQGEGEPLPDKVRLGTLCIIDTKPRDLSDGEKRILLTLTRLAVAEIQMRQKILQEREQMLDRAAQSAMQQAQDLNATYIGQVAHDLRTPLNSFKLGLQTLAAAGLSDEHNAVLDTMQVSAELMQLTTCKAMDYTKLEHSQQLHHGQMAAFSIVDVLRKSKSVVAGYTHESKNVDFQFEVSEPLLTTDIISDHDFVWQMLMNLLCNARKFTTAGHIRTSVSLSEGSEARKYVRVQVADTGIGFDPAQTHILFTPFGQLQEFSGGTGLGLWSIKAKANALGGSCGVQPNHPKGSVFWFEIPYTPGPQHVVRDIPRDFLYTPPAAGNAALVSTSHSDDLRRRLTTSGAHTASYSPGQRCNERVQGVLINSMKQLNTSDGTGEDASSLAAVCEGKGLERRASGSEPRRLLLIEDDVPTRILMGHGLRKKGFIVTEACNGEEGLNMMQAECYHMVLSDVMMPVIARIVFRVCLLRLCAFIAFAGAADGRDRVLCLCVAPAWFPRMS